MRDDTKHGSWESWRRFTTLISEFARRKVVIRQKFGGEVFAMPLLVAIVLAIFALKFLLVAAVILLLVGYRISVERR